MKRMEGFDFLRGIAMLFIILFHASVFNYANIHKVDFSNPPIIVVLISFLTLWGGLLIFYSGMVNTMRTAEREGKKQLRFLMIAGGIYIGVHYVLNILLGRWANDFVNNRPDMTFIASSIRNLQFSFPHISKWFEGSSLSTIAWNLIILSALSYWLFKDRRHDTRNYWVLGISGTMIMLISFIRIPLYPLIEQATATGNYALATILSFTIANPYPLLPYLAYGLFAAMLGLMIQRNRKDLIKKVMLPLAAGFLAYGIIGAMRFEKSISKADFFWYFKTQAELGVFMLLTIAVLFLFVYRDKELHWAQPIKNFSRITLTVYLLETAMSEVLGKLLSFAFPAWNQTINGCLLFGLGNVLLWTGILAVWSKNNFRYSLEYFWVKLFHRLGKRSTKLSDSRTDGMP